MVQNILSAKTPEGQTHRGHLRALREDTITYIEHLARQGDLLRISFGLLGSAYFVNSPDLVQEILLKQARKFHKPFIVKYTAKEFFGENLFTSDDELWQVLRAAIQPAFHAQRLNAYASIMVDYTKAMISQWQPGQVIDIPQAMMDLTLGITTKALFGQDLRNDVAGQAIIRFIELFSQRLSGFPVPAWLPIPSNWEIKRQIAIIDRHLSPLIAERHQSFAEHDDVLSMLIQAQAADTTGLLTNQQIKNEVLNLFAAGYEVTAHTLAFTLYLISQHPDVEARLLEEIDRVVGQRAITIPDLEQMPYLEMVLKESMRLLPVTTLLSRQAVESVVLKGGYTLPKNSVVLFAPWTLHRCSEYFPNPLSFDPERFHPDCKDKIPKFAYLPFSAGPRICIGNAFAMMQMRINLATILQDYRLTVAPEYQFEPFYSFNTRPKNGLPMTVEVR
ncbi:MAG: cytochrome P450 [Symplocastrum torsivum CPER-KK1]|jgi:cytochrome P450|uniref:Cytochrome P450 n=1 Tax=Symplocastrum torsivum CPER-KK1 TaxID=450513 RepID=A0A951PS71_9CYAN|nr:cytochrome P450 [Symplocastrum torsivum CPER-KK1]